MLSSIHRQERLTSGYIAGEAFSFAGGDRLAVKDAGGTSPKRQFEPGSPRQVSGPVAAETAASPDLQPRDCAPWHPTVANIAAIGSFFHSAAQSHNVTDCARHEHPSPR
jgi:hypothetical protein